MSANFQPVVQGIDWAVEADVGVEFEAHPKGTAARLAHLEELVRDAAGAAARRDAAFATTAKSWDSKRAAMETDLGVLLTGARKALNILERAAGGSVAQAKAVLKGIVP